MKFFADLIKDGLYDKSQLERDGTQVENQFKGGKLAVWIGGPWVLGSVERTDDENWVPAARKNVGVAPMPAGPTGEAYTFVGGSNLMMFKSLQEQGRGLGADEVPVPGPGPDATTPILGHVPRAHGAAAGVGESRTPTTRPFFEAIQQGRTYAPIPQWGQIENAYKTRFGNILDSAAGKGEPSHRETVKKQLDEAAKEADALLAQSGRLARPPPDGAGRAAAPPAPLPSDHRATSTPTEPALPPLAGERRASAPAWRSPRQRGAA